MCRKRCTFGVTLIAIAFTVAPGCRKDEPPAQTGKPDPEVSAKLAKADAYDGMEDKIVTKCAGCALGMDGSEEHALEIHGYTMRFCSDSCKQGFETGTTKAILAMKIPEE